MANIGNDVFFAALPELNQRLAAGEFSASPRACLVRSGSAQMESNIISGWERYGHGLWQWQLRLESGAVFGFAHKQRGDGKPEKTGALVRAADQRVIDEGHQLLRPRLVRVSVSTARIG